MSKSRLTTHRIEYCLFSGNPLRLWVCCDDEVDGITAETAARLFLSYLRHQDNNPEAMVYLDGVCLATLAPGEYDSMSTPFPN